MGNIYVHVRMKACCRNTLKDLDERKRKAKVRSGLLAVPSLFDALSEKPIDEAKKALPVGGGGADGEGEMERLVRAACEKVCVMHAQEHEGKGEKTEGGFWREAGLEVVGRLDPKKAQEASGGGLASQAGKIKQDTLKTAAAAALKAHPNACNQSTAAVAEAMGYGDLVGKTANEQVDYMEKNWKAVDAKTAQSMANQGQLLVAGHKADTHGHTTIVVPGEGATKGDGFYPNVQGGALGGPGSWGYSDGSKTAGDVWNNKARQEVKYYTPN